MPTAYARIVELAENSYHVNTREIAHQHLWVASKLHEAENILFIYGMYGWANDLMNSTKPRFLIENYILQRSKFEINISYQLRQELLSLFGYSGGGEFLGGNISYTTAVGQGLPKMMKAAFHCHGLNITNRKQLRKQVAQYVEQHTSGVSGMRPVVRPSWQRFASLGLMSRVTKKKIMTNHGLGAGFEGLMDMKPVFGDDNWFRRLYFLAEHANK